MKNLNIIGLIPARGGSKGVPRKNIKQLGGAPLIAYTIDSALQSSHLTRVVVSTDDEEIAEVAKKYGAEVPFLRPQRLATDDAPTIDTVLHVLDQMGPSDQIDLICLLQPTVPFREAHLIDTCIDHLLAVGADSLISVQEVPHPFNPYWVFEKGPDAEFLERIIRKEDPLIKRRQELPQTFYRDGAIYLTYATILQEKKSLYGEQLTYYLRDPKLNINIDDENDWIQAENYLKSAR